MSESQNTDIYKKVTFIQHHLPVIEAGEYKLDLNIKVTDKGTGQANSDETSSYNIAVKGERFRLLQETDIIYSVFPFSENPGNYSTVLPHVVFKKKTFPWVREMGPISDDITADRATWLGLFLLDEDIINTGTIGDLQSENLDANMISYPSANSLEVGETVDDIIQYIDLDKATFDSIAPSLDDLELLAHTREVSLDPKPTIPDVSDQGTAVGYFSIVFGNRLPKAGAGTSYVYLVCLAGLEDCLPGRDGTPSTKSYEKIRLAVLKNWSFTSNDNTSAGFVDIVEGLNSTPANSPTALHISPSKVTGSGENADQIKNALSMGYVPLNHDFRTADKTVSWYRGPLTPKYVEGNQLEIPISSADRATIFDPTIGMFNVSYAMAWTLGRMLALQDKAFSKGLYQWKKQVEWNMQNLVEDELIEESYPETTSFAPPAAKQSFSGPRRVVNKTSTKRKLYKGFIHQLVKFSKK